jgi:hypothetical protein
MVLPFGTWELQLRSTQHRWRHAPREGAVCPAASGQCIFEGDGMTVTKLYLIDSRLTAQRSIEVQVQFHRIASERRERETGLVRFVALAADYLSAIPIEIELSDGLWGIAFVSYNGSQVGCALTIPSENNVHYIDAAILDGVMPVPRPRPTAFGTNEYEAFDEKRPRKLVASRVVSAVAFDSLPQLGNPLANEFKITTTVMQFCGQPNTHNKLPNRQFPIDGFFESKLSYWLQNWEDVHNESDVVVEVQSIPGKQLYTGKFRVPIGNGHHRKSVLNVVFSDERYLLFVPHLGVRGGKKSRHIDIEIDFFDLPTTSTHGRISQVRVLTDNSAFNGVAQLLSKGRLDSASTLWMQSAQQVLRDKFTDPIAAAAGALALVQPEISSSIEGVHLERIWDWMTNLDSRFKWIPEGQICLAWMLGVVSNAGVMQVESNAELKSMIGRMMIEAIHRGAPIYSEGLRLLSQAVEWASSEIDDDSRVAVHWLAMHSVNAGPFLLLRNQLR